VLVLDDVLLRNPSRCYMDMNSEGSLIWGNIRLVDPGHGYSDATIGSEDNHVWEKIIIDAQLRLRSLS
jgi:hypothetical protein